MTRKLKFTIVTEQKTKLINNNTDYLILETPEEALKRHNNQLKNLDTLLDKKCSFYHGDVCKWYRNETKLHTTGYDTTYFVKAKNKGITWNDIYKTVNSIQAVPYKFINE